MKIYHYLTLALSLMAVMACEEKPQPAPPEAEAPVLLSTNPANGVTGVTGTSLTVTFTFDQNIMCTAEGTKKINLQGGAVIDKVTVSNSNLSVTLNYLEPGIQYSLTLPDGTVKGYKENQKPAAAILFTFTTEPQEPDPVDPPEDVDSEGWQYAFTAARRMGTGWNLGNTLESNSGNAQHMWIEAWTGRSTSDYETAWGQPVATRELIHMFKAAGFKTIRVPVTWYPHMGKISLTFKMINGENEPCWDPYTGWDGYAVDPVWMARVKEVVNYVIDEGLYCVLNVHHDTGEASTAWLRADEKAYEAFRERYIELWKQIADEFKDYDQMLLFESFNEMLDAKGTWNHSTSGAHEVINKWNADFVATVRATGGNNAHRNLILNTYAASTDVMALQDFRLPADSAEKHLLAEVHSYAPYLFAFDQSTYPAKTVFDDSCDREVRGIIENVNTYLVSKGIPCVLGEYGCTGTRAEEERAKQAACYVSSAAKYDIPCLYWMSLSDEGDRTALKWTSPKVKDAIIEAYRENKK